MIWFHSGLVFFILLIFFFLFSLYLLTQRRCRRSWRHDCSHCPESISLSLSLSHSERYRCRNKGSHARVRAHTHIRLRHSSCRSILTKLCEICSQICPVLQSVDFKCSGVFFSSLLQSAQDVTPFLLSFYLVLPFRAMRNYLDFKHIVDSSCCAQHLELQHSCPPPQTCVSNSVISPCCARARPNFLVSFSFSRAQDVSAIPFFKRIISWVSLQAVFSA